jgi:TRAP-type C4-dicarboxylate transport system substrate-binding protein
MKKRWLVALFALIIVGALVAGCGQDTEPSTTAAGGTETTAAGGTETTAASGEVIKLKYGAQNPETSWDAINAGKPWLAQLEEATGGKVKVQPFWAETLFKGPDAWESLKAGVGDFGWCFHGYWAGITTLADVVALPFMPIESGEEGSEILWTLYEEFPALAEQFKDNHVVTVWTSSPYYLMTTNKKIEKLDDLKGLKIRTVGGPPTEVMKAMGATPVSMGMPDTYQALQTGVLDGILQQSEAMYSYRQYEVLKYVTMVPVHAVYFSIAFNNAKWDGLPDDVKAAIESVGGLKGAKFWGANMFDSAVAEVDAKLAAEGYEVTKVTVADEEQTMWREKFGHPLWEDWVKKMESAGYSEARQILDRCVELAEKG